MAIVIRYSEKQFFEPTTAQIGIEVVVSRDLKVSSSILN